MLSFLGGVWSVFWWLVTLAIFVGYLMALFSVITDIFRDHTMSGATKAIWCFFLIVIPVLTVLVYLFVNGDAMNQRRVAAMQQRVAAANATTDPASQIQKGHELLNNGAITPNEFHHIKNSALSTAPVASATTTGYAAPTTTTTTTIN
ncbi:MAG: PLDc N-terminal domain-containing protein [Micrococcaceae bacterium]